MTTARRGFGAIGLVSVSMFCPLPHTSDQVFCRGEHDSGALIQYFAALYDGLCILDDSIVESNEASNESGAAASLHV